jgi:hypothetical protein
LVQVGVELVDVGVVEVGLQVGLEGLLVRLLVPPLLGWVQVGVMGVKMEFCHLRLMRMLKLVVEVLQQFSDGIQEIQSVLEVGLTGR